MSFNEFYLLFGQIIISLGIFLLILLSVTIILGKILIKNEKLIFPRLLLFTIDMFYGILKKFSENLGLDERIVDQIGVEVRNKINERSFKKINSEEKILILPHCLRDMDCDAKLEPSGLRCVGCNKCVIGVLKNKAEKIGYKVFIIPGGTFIKKIVENNTFKAVLGVACHQDLNLGMSKLSKFPCQGVPLIKDGCVNTRVDTKAVLEKLGISFEKYEKKLNIDSSCNKKSYSTKFL
jgi:uncharacterized protein